jgi:hypothetical protein
VYRRSGSRSGVFRSSRKYGGSGCAESYFSIEPAGSSSFCSGPASAAATTFPSRSTIRAGRPASDVTTIPGLDQMHGGR